MTVQVASVSDHARRTARRIATQLAMADALLITAGAGMSAENALPDDPELLEFQSTLDALGYGIREIAQPRRFIERPDFAWACYGHRQRLYRHSTPHDGYRMLRAWAQAMPYGSFVVTTNVDGQFANAGFTDAQLLELHGNVFRLQCSRPCSKDVWTVDEPGFTIDTANLSVRGELPHCPRCGALARPNVLMYDDTHWVDAERREQQQRCQSWLASVRGKRLLVVEIGAGEGASSVRRSGERLLERERVTLARINPRATEADEPLHVLRLPATAAIALIHETLPDVFGGASAASVQRKRPQLRPVTGTVHLRVGPVRSVDLASGEMGSLDIDPMVEDGDLPFLQRYAEAQSGWVALPPCGGLEAPGYTMTARVLGAPGSQAATPGAAIVFLQAPDERAVMTFGVGRRRADAASLWQLLYETSRQPLMALDFPGVPWVARRPEAGFAQHPQLLRYLAQFEQTLTRAYLTYLAFIDATQKRSGEEG